MEVQQTAMIQITNSRRYDNLSSDSAHCHGCSSANSASVNWPTVLFNLLKPTGYEMHQQV
jgi:hypothetical protein